METAAVKNCKIEGCKRAYRSKGYCNVHFKKWRRGETPKKPRYKTCGAENCLKPMVKAGKCEEHWRGDSGQRTTDTGPTTEGKEETKESAKAPVKEEKVEEKKE